jgi:hypothetical protein
MTLQKHSLIYIHKSLTLPRAMGRFLLYYTSPRDIVLLLWKKELLEDIFHNIKYGDFQTFFVGLVVGLRFLPVSSNSHSENFQKILTLLPFVSFSSPFSNQIQSRINCIYDRERFIIKISFRLGNGNSRKILKLKRWMKKKIWWRG